MTTAGPSLIAICGGIGSGKSVVSKILTTLGYPVYDCDSEAKRIMAVDREIHARLCSEIHPQAVVDGNIDRALISKIVFEDKDSLLRLNDIVHHAVLKDLLAWKLRNADAGFDRLFVETAIPVSSGLVRVVDDIWEVVAPEQIRIERVMRRNGLTAQQVKSRIDSQAGESLDNISHKTIHNAPAAALLPQIHKLLR